jgi:hypothetical protein
LRRGHLFRYKVASSKRLTRNSSQSASLGEQSAPYVGAIRAMAMTICCDFRAINGEVKACAGAALILGGLLLLIAP